MFKFIQKERNRKIARKEHKSISEFHCLPFNAELQARLDYKKALLINDLFEHLQLNRNDLMNVVNVENMIKNGMERGLIDEFYNKVFNGEIIQ